MREKIIIAVIALAVGLVLPLAAIKLIFLGKITPLVPASNAPVVSTPEPSKNDHSDEAERQLDSLLARETIDSPRSEFGLQGIGDMFNIQNTDGSPPTITRTNRADNKVETITLSDALYNDFGSIFLVPPGSRGFQSQSDTAFFVRRYKGYFGPVYRVDLTTGKVTMIEFYGTDLIIAPTEDRLFTSIALFDSRSNYADEVNAFKRFDLFPNTNSYVGKLPKGYAYNHGFFAPNLMGEGLAPTISAHWNPVDGLIHASIYSTKTPLEYVIGDNRRPAVGEAKFAPDQEFADIAVYPNK